MRVLVGWDDPSEAELISLYLNVEEGDVVVTTDTDELIQRARRESDWDAILMCTNLPDVEGAYQVFEKLREYQPMSPIVGVCYQEDVFRVARFMSNGMRSYIIRDSGGDYVFMLQTTLESAVEAVKAEREQQISARLREEIESVRKLQESIIPKNLECPDGYHICARYETSQIQVMGGRAVSMAGGDYYDAFSLDDNSIVLLVGDASGHGMKAAMSIMTMHTLVRMVRSKEYRDTAAFVEEINNRLCEQSVVNEEGGFITLLYAVLNADRGELQWTSAGHQPPLLQSLDGKGIEELGPEEAGGLPLGIYPGVEYETYSSMVPAKSRLLLYTDGLVEAFPENDEHHKEFGVDGVRQSLERSRDFSLEDALQSLFDDSSAFTGGAGRHDDTSIVLLERSR